MKNLLFVITLLCFNLKGFSQAVYKYGLPSGSEFDRWSVGVTGGISNLQSDIKTNTSNAINSTHDIKPRGTFGIHVGYQVSHSIGFNVQALRGYFKLAPKDPVYVKGLDTVAFCDFSSAFSEYTANMLFSFGNISFYKRNTNLHFVAEFGAGLNISKPLLKYGYSSDGINFIPYNAAVRVSNFIFPFGVGIRYRFGKFNVGLDFDYRKTFTDKLDAIGVTNSDYDGYTIISAQLNYTLGKKNKPMEWINPMELIYNDLEEMKSKIDSLTRDSDKDGVPDIYDRDNSTQPGTRVYGDGTSVNTAGNGIADNKDADNYSDHNAKVDSPGKEIDTDGDGVPDSRDSEPNTSAGSLVNFRGITIPLNTAGTVPPAITNVTNNNGGLGFFPSVFFDENKSDIKSTSYDRLLTVARVMKMNPGLIVNIVGSTDQQGDEMSNNKLGMKRAEAAKAHLVKVYQIDPARLTCNTKGKIEPLASKDSKATDYLNRRVDFIIENPGQEEKK